MSKTFDEDTVLYRADHPDGMTFGAGSTAPDRADGWSKDPDALRPKPAVQPPDHTDAIRAAEALIAKLTGRLAVLPETGEEVFPDGHDPAVERATIAAELTRLRALVAELSA